ncbi:hypothetical protein [Streptomyces acidiscabies]|uniref:Secreted protein n=1 Tax=Streptomyces acidiscabies TaxID=42234 RepID=A0AAP6BB25_9ACTN|nr:hypothetical protein [Streptomyces acidiscabies]MBZ3917228.1 hypothetical protein [Streptomyces acidiscabies]MDX2961467.1 hypothetical protein [Streptomyces acidiscabies]MDX3023255.1 hypothetical protein [Streptomyces acidiscabies]MDX3792189.1 hypothetical protein [Streptomyces acidiscabies]GAV45396.1 hypothetical protein Saa2_08384 [Streptomyces acidiscabies]
MPRSSPFRLLVCSLAVLATGTVASPSYAEPADDSTAVDLSVKADIVQQAPGITGQQKITVTNQQGTTTGKTLLTYVTPPYTNIDRAVPLPSGCVMRYQNLDPTVPEVVVCELPAGLGEKERTELSIPIDVTPRARITGMVRGVVDAVPAEGSSDTDVNLNDNWMPAYLSLTRPTPQTPDGNKTGLYLSVPMATLAEDGTAEVTSTYGNVGPAAGVGATQVTVVTPFAVNVDRDKPLPDGCAIALQEPFLGIPEIVVCTFPALAAKEQRTFTVPVRAASGGHAAGLLFGPALIAPASPEDVDPDQTDNVSSFAVLAPNRTS